MPIKMIDVNKLIKYTHMKYHKELQLQAVNTIWQEWLTISNFPANFLQPIILVKINNWSICPDFNPVKVCAQQQNGLSHKTY